MMDTIWEDALKRGPPLGEFSIRFGLPCVYISHFAKQYFCEQQLDYEYNSEKETTENEIEGTLIHEEAFAGDEADIEQIIESITNEGFYRCRIPVYFVINEILFCGEPDGLIFSKGKPIFLIELKTTSGNPNNLYKNQTIQAEAYAFALEKMGFDCENLCILIITIDQFIGGLYGRECIGIITNEIEELHGKNQFINEDALEKIQNGFPYRPVIHKIKLNRSRFLEDIADSSMYWKIERDARKMGSPHKCCQCRYSEECPRYENRWSAEENKNLVDEHSKGTSVEDIAKMLGKTKASVNNQLMRQEYPKHGKKWSEKDIERLTNFYSQNKPNSYISKTLQRKPSAIDSMLTKLGLIESNDSYSPETAEMRRKFPKYLTPWEEEDTDKLIDMFCETKSIDEMSHTLQRNKYEIIGKLERLDVIKISGKGVTICDACSIRDNCTLDLNKRIYSIPGNEIQHGDNNFWDEEEVNLLKCKYSGGTSVIELADVLQKSQQSIERKLITIDLIKCPLYEKMPEML